MSFGVWTETRDKKESEQSKDLYLSSSFGSSVL